MQFFLTTLQALCDLGQHLSLKKLVYLRSRIITKKNWSSYGEKKIILCVFTFKNTPFNIEYDK